MITTRTIPTHRPIGWSALVLLALALLSAAGLSAVAAGEAEAASPAWRLTLRSLPTNFVPGSAPVLSSSGPGYELIATNVGGAPTDGGQITITDTLPLGTTPLAPASAGDTNLNDYSCAVSGQTVTCTGSAPVDPGESIDIRIRVVVDTLAEGTTLTNQASVSGGGALSVAAATTTTVSSTPAAFGLFPGPSGLGFALNDADGRPATQAGSHPYALTVDLGLASILQTPLRLLGGGGGLRDLRTALPRGLVVDPNAVPSRCTEPQLETNTCPLNSQVGTVSTITVSSSIQAVLSNLYNMVPTPTAPAILGFNAAGVNIFVHVVGGVRASDYALSADTHDILSLSRNPVLGVQVRLWGDPSSRSHDSVRGSCTYEASASPCPVAPRTTPFLTMPTACSDSLTFSASAASWLDPDIFTGRDVEATDVNGDPTGVSGCSQLAFDPRIGFEPDTRAADSSSGMDVDLQIPQTNDLSTLATAHLKKAVVTLPEGMALNPSAADGLAGCSEAKIGVTSEDPIEFDASDPRCPDGSKVGTATVTTPLLPDPLEGVLYVADPKDNPFDTLLAGYLVVQGQGITIKLAGRFDRDPVTGRLTAIFDNNPQLPFSELKLHFKGGSRGVLVTPPRCGDYGVGSSLSPWSAADPDNPTAAETRSLTSRFDIDGGPGGRACPGGEFDPGFEAGTVTPQAGSHSPLVLRVSRPDGQQELGGVDATLPLGLTAKLAGIPRCRQSAIVAGVGGRADCPADSRVGSVDVGAGAGPTPFFLRDQPVYLTEGYGGAPFGLAIDSHALAGPFDLGHVVVRSKLNVDPSTARVSADAEDLPRIIEGIPLHLRSVALKMDRDKFVLNPTNCAEKAVAGDLQSTAGAVAHVSSRFQVGDCRALSFAPKLALRLTGKKQVKTGKHPGVSAQVTQKGIGEAGIMKAAVRLPKSLALDPDNAGALCEFDQGTKPDLEDHCPKGSIVGRAKATTPLLDKPLAGNVYFVKNIRVDKKTGNKIRTLPMIVVALRGEIAINLKGTSSTTKNGRLVNTFAAVPDAPISRFNLNIAGGANGILTVTRTARARINLCASRQTATANIDGQNGARRDFTTHVKTPCAKKSKTAKRKKAAARRR